MIGMIRAIYKTNKNIINNNNNSTKKKGNNNSNNINNKIGRETKTRIK